jgi:Tfp pilus assembly protein PilO
MTRRILDAIDKLNPRLVLALMLLVIGLLAFEGWMLLLRKPFAEYRQIAATRLELAAALNQFQDQSSDLGTLAAELRQLSDNLSGQLHLPASDDKIAASLMEALDRSAVSHSLKLSSVKPRERKPVSVFEEVSFEVGAKGGYLPLCQWMLDFGNTLGGSATISEFDMKSAEEGKTVLLTLKLALYRPQQTSEVGK